MFYQNLVYLFTRESANKVPMSDENKVKSS